MKSTAIVCAIAAASLGFGSLAQAQDHDRRGDRQGWEQRTTQRDAQGDAQRDTQRDQQRTYQRNEVQRQEVQRAPQRDAWQGRVEPSAQYTQRDTRRFEGARDLRYDGRRDYRTAYNEPRFYRGGYAPYEYRQPRYYVNDWYARHLSAPPYGYQWVQADNGDYLLIALATGLIANLLLNQY